MCRHRLGILLEPDQVQVFWQRHLAAKPHFAPAISCNLTFEHHDEMTWYQKYYRGESVKEIKRATIFEIRMKHWGRKMFRVLFENPKNRQATFVFDQAVRAGLANTELVITSGWGGHHNIPWELLYSPKHDYLAPQLGSMYRIVPQYVIERPFSHPSGKPLNILLVIARPNGEGDMSPVVLSEPLLKKIGPWLRRGRVKLKVLRPPTFLEFNRELGDNKGYWHVVHFDGHGVLGNLIFEKPVGGPDYISARQVANSLRNCDVPLVILDACDSGVFYNLKMSSSLGLPSELKEPSPSISIASELIALGTKAVVTMAYPVHTQASSDFMVAFYAGILMGKSVADCVAAGRRLLFLDSERTSDTSTFKMSDWMIPVLYQQDCSSYTLFPKSIKGKSSFPAALEADSESKVERKLLVGVPGPGSIDFMGRVDELFNLERLFQESPVVVLSGKKGQGKTALACEMARFLVRTSGRQRVFYRSFKGKGDFRKVVLDIGKLFMGDQFQTIGFSKQRRGVVNYLRRHPCLLIWDRFERVGKTQNSPREKERKEKMEIASFLNKFRDGPAWILIITRQDENWLSRRFRRFHLNGLGEGEWQIFAIEIMQQHQIEPEDVMKRANADYDTIWQQIVSLTNLLAKNPLLMKKELPKLSHKSPKDLKREIREKLKINRGIMRL